MDETTPRPLVAQAAEAAELRELLAVILEALTPPYAATTAGGEVRNKLIAERAVRITAAVDVLLNKAGRYSTVRDHIDVLREMLTETPAQGYVTAEVARARRDAGEGYMQSVREDFPNIDFTEERS